MKNFPEWKYENENSLLFYFGTKLVFNVISAHAPLIHCKSVARTLKKLRTSKRDYLIKQWFSSIVKKKVF